MRYEEKEKRNDTKRMAIEASNFLEVYERQTCEKAEREHVHRHNCNIAEKKPIYRIRKGDYRTLRLRIVRLRCFLIVSFMIAWLENCFGARFANGLEGNTVDGCSR